VIERLIQTGAFDSLGRRREILLGNFERAVEYVQSIKDEKKFGQGSLFGESGEKEYPDFEFEDFPETAREEKLKVEKELIGFYFSGNPMDEYRDIWKYSKELDLHFLNLGKLDNAAPGTYTVIGALKSLRTHIDKKGKEMAFGSLEDSNGEIDLVFFAKAWEECKPLAVPEKILAISGAFEPVRNNNARKTGLLVSGIHDLNELLQRAANIAMEQPKPKNTKAACSEIHIRLNSQASEDEKLLYPLKNYMTENPGACPVFIHVPASLAAIGKEAKEVIIRISEKIDADKVELMTALSNCDAVADVWALNK
jgi:DNA polymerase-3 subunit alpha